MPKAPMVKPKKKELVESVVELLLVIEGLDNGLESRLLPAQRAAVDRADQLVKQQYG